MAKMTSFQDEINRNKRKSIFLVITIFIFFVVLGYAISFAFDPGYFFIIMIIATIFSLSYVLITYYKSDKIALSAVHAKPASRTQHRMLFNAVEAMSISSGLPMPKVYIMESEQINAFASGRSPEHAVICVTSGTLEKLNKQELEGVIAHEMGHVANYDIRFMTLVTVMVGVISIIAQIYIRSLWFSSMGRDRGNNNMAAIFMLISILVAILAPITAQLVSLSISRKREYTADATGVKFTRYPRGLISALRKIQSESITEKDKKRYPHATASLFISNPFKRRMSGLFATHPPIEKRIERLERM